MGSGVHHRADIQASTIPIGVLPHVDAGGRVEHPVVARVRRDALGADQGVFRWDHFWVASALNVVYLALGAAVFAWSMRDARDRGTLLQMGE